MSTTLPPLDPRRDDSGGETSRGAEASRRGPRRRSLAALMTATALLGGGASTGLLAATGALGDSTTTVVRTAPHPASGGAAGLDAGALTAGAADGVAHVTAEGAGRGAGPFGRGGGGRATGSGFVIDEDGHIVTAAHVVDGAAEVTVTFADGTARTATVVGADNAIDVALLRVDPDGLDLHPLELGASASVQVGDEVAAIGSPFGYRGSVSTGIVSGLDRSIRAPNGFTVAGAIQTDAALNPGNSGGPVLDASGRVIGMADQIATGGAEQSAGVGFAVPIDVIADALDELKAGRAVEHPWLGVSTADAAGGAGGAAVVSVTPGGPAAAAGVRDGDVVTALGGEAVASASGLVAAVGEREPGDQVALTVRRGGRTLTLSATVGTQPASAGAAGG